MADPISIQDTEKLLLRLGDVAERVVLVGGQAVNFWADHFGSDVGELQRDQPFTSEDIDIMVPRHDVRAVALRLRGKARVAGFDDHTPSLATVTYVDERGARRVLDVMNTILGVDTQEILRKGVPVERSTSTDATLQFRVMHPVLVMESRATNVIRLPGQYSTDRGLRQADASVLCAREFLLQSLAEAGAVEDVLDWNERIFRFRTKSDVGRKLAYVHRIDVFGAVVVDSRLGDRFLLNRYPQMVAAVEQLRRA